MLQGLQRIALSRAFGGRGSRGWLIAGTAVWLLRTANRLRKPEPETIYRAKLEPGEHLVIDHQALDQTGRPIRRADRRQLRAERKSARRRRPQG